jgi:hypothetical protein
LARGVDQVVPARPLRKVRRSRARRCRRCARAAPPASLVQGQKRAPRESCRPAERAGRRRRSAQEPFFTYAAGSVKLESASISRSARDPGEFWRHPSPRRTRTASAARDPAKRSPRRSPRCRRSAAVAADADQSCSPR